MVRSHRIITAAFAFAILAQSAVGQSSASLTHTVSVTVPPRVKVQVGAIALSATPMTGSAALKESTQGIALSVNATRAWVLSIASAQASRSHAASIRWSRDANSGFASLATGDITIASGALSAQPKSADVFFRGMDAAAERNGADARQAPVVLTVAAP
jgi:hypothetical protein